MRIVGITQARFGSSRLRGKVLKVINGKPMLAIHLERLMKSRKVDDWVLATTTEPESESIIEIAENLGVKWYQGSLSDVLDRFYQAAKSYHPDYVVRVTADCPLVDPGIVDAVCECMIEENADFATNTIKRTFADGFDVEAFSFRALEKAWNVTSVPKEREHVTPYIKNNSTLLGGNLFKSVNYDQNIDESGMRLTVDYQQDLDVIKQLVDELGPQATYREYIDLLKERPDISTLNKMYQNN